MDAEIMVGFELGNIDQKFYEPTAVSTASCKYVQREDAGSMGSEISESGWTMYFDQSLDSWSNKSASNQFDMEKQHKKNSHDTENAERNPSYDYQASSITGNEDDSSMASDASSGPQKLPLPLPVEDIQLQQDRQAAGSYSLDSRRKRGAHGKHEDFECMASCSSVDVNFTRNKLRKLKKNEDEHELALWLQDTASSPIHRPEVQQVNRRFEGLQSLLHDGVKIVEKRRGGAIEYSNSGDE